MRRLVLLDTDFISKTHIVRIDDNNHLIDRVLDLPECSFICHEQTGVELRRHNSHAPEWLDEKIKSGEIEQYTDERILKEMTGLYFNAGLYQHTALLKTACEAFDNDYFQEHFKELGELNYTHISLSEYLSLLKCLDNRIGEGNNLGEIKEYVLLQWLNIQNEEPVFYFCSDDKDARNGVLAVDGIKIQCISLASAFEHLRKKGVLTTENAEPYIQAALDYYNNFKQENIHVIEASPVGRHLRVPCEQVLREIFEGAFMELPNGYLKYRIKLESKDNEQANEKCTTNLLKSAK